MALKTRRTVTTPDRIRFIALCMAIALLAAGAPPALAQDAGITVDNLDAILEANPLPPEVPAKVIATSRAGDSELQVLRMRRIRLHHHDQEDHVVYVARGEGTIRMETADGQLETRRFKPGDIYNLPRGKKHSLEKIGDEDIVLLVVATAGWKPLEDTVFHEE
jgi:mannose-6-phosphate isomerase-like protein (cupin superfamily)